MKKEQYDRLRNAFIERSLMSNELAGDMFDILVDENEFLSDMYDAQLRLGEVAQYGCVNGTVPYFIYTSDCGEFYVKHIDALEMFVEEMTSDYGDGNLGLGKKNPRYVDVCWLAAEHSARGVYELIDDMFLGYGHKDR